jgi:hypothetical protein
MSVQDETSHTIAVRERPNIAVYIPEYVAVCRLSTSVQMKISEYLTPNPGEFTWGPPVL